MPRFDHLRGVFGLLPTPYREDYEIHTEDLRRVADFCCRSGQQSPFRGLSHGAGRYRRSLLSLEFWASVISISSVSSTSSLQWPGLRLQPILSAHNAGTRVSV